MKKGIAALVILAGLAGLQAEEWNIGNFKCTSNPAVIRLPEKADIDLKFTVVLPPWRLSDSRNLSNMKVEKSVRSGILTAGAYKLPYTESFVREGDRIKFKITLDSGKNVPFLKTMRPYLSFNVSVKQDSLKSFLIGKTSYKMPFGNKWFWDQRFSFPAYKIAVQLDKPVSMNVVGGKKNVEFRLIAPESAKKDGGISRTISGTISFLK